MHYWLLLAWFVSDCFLSVVCVYMGYDIITDIFVSCVIVQCTFISLHLVLVHNASFWFFTIKFGIFALLWFIMP